LISLLKSLPKKIHMAFVLVQHLEPQHKSALTEILSRETPLQIREAKNNTTIEPAHVYVIPPNTLMAVSRGKLQITSRKKRADGRYLPVDFCMASLAEDQREKAVGIVLSGTGSDGTLGAKAIKAKGGITFAQDEKTARYYGMPESAIASGSVDFVLDPGGIAKKLVHIGAHGYSRPFGRADTLRPAENGLPMVLALLRDLTGVDFIHYKQTTISRRVARRMSFHATKSYPDYYNCLKRDPAEAGVLLKDILIPVTAFFRDPEVFAALRKRVFPCIAHNRTAKDPVRIWVPACSTGEEVYSVAIALYEFLEERKIRPFVQVFGTDLSDILIEHARAGAYGEDIAGHVSPERLRCFFVKTETGYRIAKHIRDLCIFARHDITGDPPLSNMDIASCRNLLIYLDTFFQNKALSMLHYALKPKGFLVLGTSESVTAVPGLFAVVDKKCKIFSRNSVARIYRSGAMTPGEALKSPPAEVRKADRKARTGPGADTPGIRAYPKKAGAGDRPLQKAGGSAAARGGTAQKDIARLRKEFARTVERLNAISEEKDTFNEELKAANEEIQSSNEELQSMNEELETSKEELQSTNEELLSLNEELQNKNAELARLNSDLNNVFSSTNIPMIIVGNDLRIKSFTPTARKVMNVIATDVDRPIGDIKLNIDIANLEEMIREVIDDMVPKGTEVQDKEGRWYSVRIRPYRTLDNRIEGVVLTMIDIDVIKRTQDELQGALNYNRAIIETIREPLLVLDKDARILSVNKSFCKMFMVQASDVENKLLYELGAHQWDRPELRKLLQGALSRNTVFNDYEVSFDFPNIGQKTMLLNARQIKMYGKAKEMVLLAIEDITRRKAADDVLKRDSIALGKMVDKRSRALLDLRMKLERKQRLSDVGTLAATVAHELRNTLAAINVAAYNIRRKMKDPRAEESLRSIEKKVSEGAQIINNILRYSKISTPRFEWVEINGIMRECLHELTERFAAQGISVNEKLGFTEELSVEVDPVQLKEVFFNILYNAIDAVGKKAGKIEIESKATGSAVSVVIKDNGEGMEKKHLKKAADPFFTTKAKGTGLGLAVCKQMLALHDGSLGIESDKGKGAAVRVTIPIRRLTHAKKDTVR